ncbi:actin-related protein 10-like [Lineus longissimus]|uniref:actin-related protein 10-like n=1 Tax=Lineus longissimus TaxID=88925 RepID=UPI00315D50EB
MPLFEGIHVSYTGEKTAVVLDIGAAYTKSGFAGENGPRCILPSELVRPKTGQLVKIIDFIDKEELYDVLVEYLHKIYFRHLLVNPKDRRVVICESILCQSSFRDMLARVLFRHYEVPSVLFAPSHQLALLTLAANSGLVIDVGFTESLVLPIYEGIPVLKAWEAIPLGGKAVQTNLQSQLLEGANVTTQEQGERPLSSVISSIEERILEDIKVRCCFTTKFDRAEGIHAARLKESGYGEDGATGPKPPPGVDYPLDGEKMLHIDGKIRESAYEVLFEQDNEERSVATLILDAIRKCPLDMRRYLSENIVIIGGTSMAPGFKARLKDELYSLMEKPKYKEDLAIQVFKFHKLPAKENYAAWLGGAIFGALEVLGSRSLTREQFSSTGRVPDWSSISDDNPKEEDERLPVPRGR